jgi:hypothetical protein
MSMTNQWPLAAACLILAAGPAFAQRTPANDASATPPSAVRDDKAPASQATPPGPPAEAPQDGATRSAAGRSGKKSKAGPAKSDFLALGTTTVTGNKELPKVMYIVPWKQSDIGDLNGKPVNSLLDEVLAPVDRDVFRREVGYYRALSSAPRQNAAPAVPAPQGEK